MLRNGSKDTKSTLKKSIAFLYTDNELAEKGTRQTTPFTVASKTLKRNQPNQRDERPLQWKLQSSKEKLRKMLENRKIASVHGLAEIILLNGILPKNLQI